MVKVCAVKSCPSGRKIKTKTKDTYSVSFFQARTPSRLRRWVESLGIPLKASDFICQFHFMEKDIKMYQKIVIGNVVHLHPSGKKTLIEEALPTIEHQLQFHLKPQQQDGEEQQQQLKQEQQQQLKQEQQQQLKQEQQRPEEKQQVLEEDQQQSEQTPEIIEPITYVKKKLSILPQHWLYVDKPNEMEFMWIDLTRMHIKSHIVLHKDCSVSLILSNNERMSLHNKISSPDEIFQYLKSIEKWQLCVGTQIAKQRYSKHCKRVIIGDETYVRTVMNPRCKACRVLRQRIQNCGNILGNTSEKSAARKRRSANFIRKCKRLKTKAILKFLQFIEDWEKLGPMPTSKSILVGLKVTLRATLQILDALHIECDYTYLMTAILSQDLLERFLSTMRFSCGSNNHPDHKMSAHVYHLASSFSLIRPPKGCNVDGLQVLKALLGTTEWLQSIDVMLDNSSLGATISALKMSTITVKL